MSETSPTSASAAAPSAKPAAATPWSPARHHPLVRALFVGVIIVGVLAVLAAWRLPPFAGPDQSTEDAYVQGLTTVISPQVSGYVLDAPKTTVHGSGSIPAAFGGGESNIALGETVIGVGFGWNY